MKLVKFQYCRATVESGPFEHYHTARERLFGFSNTKIYRRVGFFVMVKYAIGWLLVLGLRLVPFRPANIEPLMATLMPYAKRYGAWGGFVFGFLSMVIYDVITQKVGSWTWITAATYGLIGVGAYFYFKKYKNTAKNYVVYSVIGTLVFDAITGVAMGPLLYGQPLATAFIGQIPFTARHLLSSVVSSLVLSVAIDRWIVANAHLDTQILFSRLFAKAQS